MTVAIVLLVMMSAYFSATETAFSCLNKIRMKSRAESGDHRAALAMDLVEDYDRLISTILIGNNIVNITASTVGTVLFTKLYAAYGPTVSTVVLTLVVLIFGEISPKSLAKEHAESFAMFSAPILRVFLLVLRPLNFLFSQWKRLLNMIFHPSEDQGITEEELITMVSEAENEGGLDQHESQLIRSAIEFGDLEAGDILTPRVDIVAVEDSASMEEIAAVFAESGYSRLPVYHKDVDDIVGVIHEKDFNAARYRGQGNISGCITPVHYTTANADLGLLLRTLQKKKTHMAIVVDEYGGTEGLLTMEDILEELVGEIWDEHDEVIETFRKQSDGREGIPAVWRKSLLQEEPEKKLADVLDEVLPELDNLWNGQNYAGILATLKKLRPFVDAFFDGVMVNCDDAALRNNRLALLKAMADRFSRVADFAALQI